MKKNIDTNKDTKDRNIDILEKTGIFNGISREALGKIWDIYNSKCFTYQKGAFLINQGSTVEFIGILLEGNLQIIKEYDNGERFIIAELEPGDYFGESLYFARTDNSPVSVYSKTNTNIAKLKLSDLLLSPYELNSSKILTNLPNVKLMENMRETIITNLFESLSKKNLFLQQRIEILSKRSIEEKVMTLLHSYYKIKEKELARSKSQNQKQSENQTNSSLKKVKKKYVILPMNREEMADYLAVDRTALSHQLSKMKQKGLIDFYKNTFILLDSN